MRANLDWIVSFPAWAVFLATFDPGNYDATQTMLFVAVGTTAFASLARPNLLRALLPVLLGVVVFLVRLAHHKPADAHGIEAQSFMYVNALPVLPVAAVVALVFGGVSKLIRRLAS